MPTLAKRLESAMVTVNVNQDTLAKLAHTSQVTISNILNGKTKNPRNLLEIANALGVAPQWLQFGSQDNTSITRNYFSSHSGSTQISDNVEVGLREESYEGISQISKFDIKLSAGTGLEFDWSVMELEDPVMLPIAWFKIKGISPNMCKAMIVRGNSMSPLLESGDTVIINTKDNDINSLEDGEIYVIIYNRKVFIREIRHTSKGLKFVSFNKEYEHIEIDYNDPNEQLLILGKKVWRGG